MQAGVVRDGSRTCLIWRGQGRPEWSEIYQPEEWRELVSGQMCGEVRRLDRIVECVNRNPLKGHRRCDGRREAEMRQIVRQQDLVQLEVLHRSCASRKQFVPRRPTTLVMP